MALADPNIDWVGLGPLLSTACDQLEVGQMVQSSTFCLFEAMSAVEIGNPKMDAGARPKLDRVPLQDRPLKLDMSRTELISWMDHMLCLEATWHVGGALAQTVYSSLHMMQIHRLSGNPTLAGYCRGLQALCQEVNALVLQGCVCEEEDFVCHSTGLPMEDEPEAAEKVLGALSLAMDAQDANMAAAKGSTGCEDPRLSAALHSRLHLRKLLYQAVSRMRQRTKQDLDAAAKCLGRAANELAAAKASAQLGSVDEGDQAAWGTLGFDPGLNSHLAPPAPPRVIKPVARDEAFDYFEALIKQLMRACRVTTVSDFNSLENFVASYSASRPCAVARAALHLQLAQQATLEQAAAASPGAPAAPPALAPAQQPWAPSPPMMRAAASCLGMGVALGDDADLFIDQALIAVGNWVQAALLNPARHRRRLRRGLEDWCHLYQHAVNADCSEKFGSSAQAAGWNWRGGSEYPGPLGPLSAWVERQTAKVVAAHLLMGFELDLYEPRDYAMLYWYIDYLHGVIEQDSKQLAAARPTPAAIEAAAKAAAAASSATSSAKKAHGKSPKGPALPKRASSSSMAAAAAPLSPAVANMAAVRATFSGDHLQIAHSAALRHLCQGMMHMLVALSAAGVLSPPELPFNSMEERYDQRFGSLHILTRPEPLAYSVYKAAVDLKGAAPQGVLAAAATALAQAAQSFKALSIAAEAERAGDDYIKDCHGLERVAQQNRLACMVAERAITTGTQLNLQFEFCHHRSFPVAVLKSKKT